MGYKPSAAVTSEINCEAKQEALEQYLMICDAVRSVTGFGLERARVRLKLDHMASGNWHSVASCRNAFHTRRVPGG